MKEHAEITVRDIANRTSSHMVIKDNGNGSALIPGEKYQLQNAFVGRSNTRVLLRNITGYFNSVMFDFVDGNGKPVNIYEMPQFRMY